MLSGSLNNSKECKVAVFPRFSSSAQRLVVEQNFTSSGVKPPENRKKKTSVRHRSWTISRFHSTGWFGDWRSKLGKQAPMHFVEFSSCMARDQATTTQARRLCCRKIVGLPAHYDRLETYSTLMTGCARSRGQGEGRRTCDIGRGAATARKACALSDLRPQISDLRSQISDLRPQISDLRSQTSDLKSQASGLTPQASRSAPPIDFS